MKEITEDVEKYSHENITSNNSPFLGHCFKEKHC